MDGHPGLAWPLMYRVASAPREAVAFTLDGLPMQARAGDTVLAAVLTRAAHLRTDEASGMPRAGLCFMGACQDCWMWEADGRRIRACTEPLRPGMALATRPPAAPA